MRNIEEDEGGDGVVTSGDFGSAIPADARHNWKDDGKELNKQARKSLKDMGVEILYAGDSGKTLKENLKIKIGKKIYKLA